MQKILKWVGAWLVCGLIAAVLATLIQTQVVIAMLPDTAPAVGLSERVSMSMFDLRYLGGLYGQILLGALLVAFLAAEGVARLTPVRLRQIVFAVAGAVAIFVMFKGMKMAFFGTDLIAGARNWWGYALQMGVGALAGWLMARLTRRRRRSRYAVD